MKLYNANLSVWASRCRLVLYAKGLDAEILAPPGGISSDEYKTINPTGKIPALEVDGQILPESEVICAYLEEISPEPSLMPEDPMDRAHMRLLNQYANLYVNPAWYALIPYLNDPSSQREELATGLADLIAALALVDGQLGEGPYALGSQLTQADCALVPSIFCAFANLRMFKQQAALNGLNKLTAWWSAVQNNEACARVISEMETALQEYARSLQAG